LPVPIWGPDLNTKEEPVSVGVDKVMVMVHSQLTNGGKGRDLKKRYRGGGASAAGETGEKHRPFTRTEGQKMPGKKGKEKGE